MVEFWDRVELTTRTERNHSMSSQEIRISRRTAILSGVAIAGCFAALIGLAVSGAFTPSETAQKSSLKKPAAVAGKQSPQKPEPANDQPQRSVTNYKQPAKVAEADIDRTLLEQNGMRLVSMKAGGLQLLDSNGRPATWTLIDTGKDGTTRVTEYVDGKATGVEIVQTKSFTRTSSLVNGEVVSEQTVKSDGEIERITFKDGVKVSEETLIRIPN